MRLGLGLHLRLDVEEALPDALRVGSAALPSLGEPEVPDVALRVDDRLDALALLLGGEVAGGLADHGLGGYPQVGGQGADSGHDDVGFTAHAG